MEIEEIIGLKFDVILGNINSLVLYEKADEVRRISKIGTSLLLSGILADKELEIIDRYQNKGWHLKENYQEGEWVALLFHLVE